MILGENILKSMRPTLTAELISIGHSDNDTALIDLMAIRRILCLTRPTAPMYSYHSL